MASVVDTSVKFAHSEMVGAPVVNGVAGSLISALDAFLVNGFGSKSVDSATVTAGVCRLNFSSGASCVDLGSVLLVEGAANAALNGQQRVTAFSAAWVEFATDQADGAVSGTISFKAASLGWEKVFSKTNVAVYRPTDPTSTRCYLRVDDTQAMYASAVMYESMTDVDTGVGMAPAPATVAGGYKWYKRSAAGAAGVTWALIGDNRGCYFALAPYMAAGAAGVNGYVTTYFGDLNSYRSGDAYAATITGGTSTNQTTTTNGDVFRATQSAGFSVMRRSTGIGTTQTCDRTAYGSAVASGFNGPFGPAPSTVDNGVYMTPIVLSDGGPLATNGPRGELPGALSAMHTAVPALLGYGRGQMTGSGPYQGRRFLFLTTTSAPHVTTDTGTGFFDITGPWR